MPKHLVDVVNDYCLHKLGVLPDLANPKGYNDKVNWLKIHDQMTEQVTGCDKLLARAYVADRIDRSCLLDVYQMARSVDQIAFEALPERYVLKTNHDSGSAYVVTDKSALRRARRKIRRRIKRTYGAAKGEWAYSHISPYVFAEECMQGPIVDYKFHCALGDILWVQIIADRAAGTPRETIVDQNYTTLPLHMSHKMVHEPQAPPRPGSWDGMKTLARALSEPFRYVRVDLYHYQKRPVFGELTFWPLAGCYKTKDEPTFGSMLPIDTSFKRPMIHDVIGGQTQERGAIRALADAAKRKLRHMTGTAF